MYMYLVAALIPMVVGFLYYSPMLFGKAWMSTNNFTEEYLKEGNMGVILGVSFLLSAMFAMALGNSVVHQTSVAGLLVPEIMDTSSAAFADLKAFMGKYGDRHRTFSHGAVHGVINAIFFILPIIGINALFERRGWKYIGIHFGYWLITVVLMAGLLSATLQWAPM